jgi:hypothetical protein
MEVNTSDLLQRLNSEEHEEIFCALLDIGILKRTEFRLTPELIKKLRELLHYEYPDKQDPEYSELNENIRDEAICILGALLPREIRP